MTICQVLSGKWWAKLLITFWVSAGVDNFLGQNLFFSQKVRKCLSHFQPFLHPYPSPTESFILMGYFRIAGKILPLIWGWVGFPIIRKYSFEMD
jgi:hypothetical protein